MMKITVQGERKLRRTLEALPVRVQRQVARKTLRPGATIISRAMKAAVPSISDQDAAALGEWDATGKALTRHIKKGIGRRSKTYRNTGTAMLAIGPRYDFRTPGVEQAAGYLAQRLEYGDDERPAVPFMRRAVEGVAGKAMRAMIDKATEAVADAAAEARRG
jgi:HK97 gp10 family phage protein